VDATSFELNMSVPGEARFASTLRELAIHAARYAGCRGPDAEQFGAVVEQVASQCLSAGAASVPVIVRRGNGPVEMLVGSEREFEAPDRRDAHITVAWTREAGVHMCRVARSMPSEV
jgi:hypothetical protein